MSTQPYHVAIIGGGFSGVMVAVNLLKLSGGTARISLIEKSERFAKGVAYSTQDKNHLLNVPAGNMSALPDNPGHFLEWLATNGYEANKTAYYPRKVYGEYIESFLHGAGSAIEKIPSAVVDLEIDNESATITLANGEVLKADAAVLALGNLPPVITDAQRALFQLDSNIAHNPWGQQAKLANINKNSRILVIGTGLTMVDIVTSIFEKEHEGEVTAISRHGFLPQPHVLDKPKYNLTLPAEISVLKLFRFLRSEIAEAEKSGLPWQSVFDELRPHTVPVWQALPVREKRRFMRHLRSLWDTRRHRMSLDVARRLKKLTANNKLRIRAGRICHINPLKNQFEVAFKPRGSNSPLVVEKYDFIINCASPETDLEESRDRLIQNLLAKDLIRSGTLHMGLRTDSNGAVIGKGDYASPYLYALGPLCKGQLWETTAVPELRVQAQKLAETLQENLSGRVAARQGADI